MLCAVHVKPTYSMTLQIRASGGAKTCGFASDHRYPEITHDVRIYTLVNLPEVIYIYPCRLLGPRASAFKLHRVWMVRRALGWGCTPRALAKIVVAQVKPSESWDQS